MSEIISAVVKFVVISVIVLGCFWLFKHRTRASIEQGDKSMDTTAFPEGGYSVDTSIETVAGIRSGNYVAYRLPKDPATTRIARVIGVEGNRIELTATEVRVNDAALTKRTEANGWTIPETLVPRGCVYVLADDTFSGVDSRQIGPVPFTYIVGTVKPSR